MSHPDYDRLLMGSPLRRTGVSKAITIVLLAILAFATLIQLVVFTGMPPNLFNVFLRALALSSLLALVPLAILWFLDRREREFSLVIRGCLSVGRFDRYGSFPALQHRLP